MATYKFSKKTSVILRPFFGSHSPKNEIFLDGYTTSKQGFPFAIVKNTEYKQRYWLIVNRFSGRPIVYRFNQKQKAEKFFQKFAKLYNVDDIEFKNPLSEFQYKKASFEVKRALEQDEYMRRNYGV